MGATDQWSRAMSFLDDDDDDNEDDSCNRPAAKGGRVTRGTEFYKARETLPSQSTAMDREWTSKSDFCSSVYSSVRLKWRGRFTMGIAPRWAQAGPGGVGGWAT